jgi:hypothetical protein
VEILQNVGIRPTSLSPASDKRFEDIQKLGETLSHLTHLSSHVIAKKGLYGFQMFRW